MAFATGEVIETPDGEKLYAAIFRQGVHIIFNLPVDSVKEGEARIAKLLASLGRLARDDGYLDNA